MQAGIFHARRILPCSRSHLGFGESSWWGSGAAKPPESPRVPRLMLFTTDKMLLGSRYWLFSHWSFPSYHRCPGTKGCISGQSFNEIPNAKTTFKRGDPHLFGYRQFLSVATGEAAWAVCAIWLLQAADRQTASLPPSFLRGAQSCYQIHCDSPLHSSFSPYSSPSQMFVEVSCLDWVQIKHPGSLVGWVWLGEFSISFSHPCMCFAFKVATVFHVISLQTLVVTLTFI